MDLLNVSRGTFECLRHSFKHFSIKDIHKICNEHWHYIIKTKQIISNPRLVGSYSCKYSNKIHKVVDKTVDSKAIVEKEQIKLNVPRGTHNHLTRGCHLFQFYNSGN